MNEEEYKPEDCIGCEVMATMNLVDWFSGTLEGLNEFFIPYRVKLKDSEEIRSFAHVQLVTCPTDTTHTLNKVKS